MAGNKQRGYDTTLVAVRSAYDGYKHLAATLIEHAIAGADNGEQDEIDWLLSKGPTYAAGIGMDNTAFIEAMWLKYKT